MNSQCSKPGCKERARGSIRVASRVRLLCLDHLLAEYGEELVDSASVVGTLPTGEPFSVVLWDAANIGAK